jgi:hypothetical protein
MRIPCGRSLWTSVLSVVKIQRKIKGGTTGDTEIRSGNPDPAAGYSALAQLGKQFGIDVPTADYGHVDLCIGQRIGMK